MFLFFLRSWESAGVAIVRFESFRSLGAQRSRLSGYWVRVVWVVLVQVWSGVRRREGYLFVILFGFGDVFRVGVFCDRFVYFVVAVGGEEGFSFDKEVKVVVKGVAFFRFIFREEVVV